MVVGLQEIGKSARKDCDGCVIEVVEDRRVEEERVIK